MLGGSVAGAAKQRLFPAIREEEGFSELEAEHGGLQGHDLAGAPVYGSGLGKLG